MGLRRTARARERFTVTVHTHEPIEVPGTPNPVFAAFDVEATHFPEDNPECIAVLVCCYDDDGHQHIPTLYERDTVKAWLASSAGQRWEREVGDKALADAFDRAVLGGEP